MLICAPVTSRSGYGSHARDLVWSFLDSDKYDIKIIDVRWGECPQNALNKNNSKDKRILDCILSNPTVDKQPDIYVDIRIPNEFAQHGKFNIGITAGIETTMCSKDWIDGLNRVDLVIVPSQHSKTVFDNTKYQQIDNNTKKVMGEMVNNTPVEVLFEGADTNIFKKTNDTPEILNNTLADIKEDKCFLYVGHWLKGDLGQDRKDTGMLVKVFLETFKNKQNPPALIMKTSGATFSIMDREEIMSKIALIQIY